MTDRGCAEGMGCVSLLGFPYKHPPNKTRLSMALGSSCAVYLNTLQGISVLLPLLPFSFFLGIPTCLVLQTRNRDWPLTC